MIFALMVTFITVVRHNNPPTHGVNYGVMVKTCKGQVADIFADKRMTIRLPNPLYPDFSGSYKFYTPSSCIKIEE